MHALAELLPRIDNQALRLSRASRAARLCSSQYAELSGHLSSGAMINKQGNSKHNKPAGPSWHCDLHLPQKS